MNKLFKLSEHKIHLLVLIDEGFNLFKLMGGYAKNYNRLCKTGDSNIYKPKCCNNHKEKSGKNYEAVKDSEKIL